MRTDTKSSSRKGVGKYETALVVVDEVLIRMVIADYLRQCGYRVIEAADPDEAIVVLQHPQAQVEIVLTTVEMSDTRDGFALSHWVREHRPGVEVILAGSLKRAADSASDLCEQGPHGKKPYEAASIIAEVNQLLAAAKRASTPSGL